MAPEAFPGEAAKLEWERWDRAKKWVEQAVFTHLPTGAVVEANDAVRRLAARYTATFPREAGGTLPQGPHEQEELQLVFEFPFVTALAAPAESPRSGSGLAP